LECKIYFASFGVQKLVSNNESGAWGYSHSTPLGLFNPIFKAFEKHKISMKLSFSVAKNTPQKKLLINNLGSPLHILLL
jgi:hypothetical protein